jgi:NAD(P)-dependent dehydrogenase (short-subunit alcohol dehydrogenase family)
MKVIVIGATGTIGAEIVNALKGHEVITVSRKAGEHRADIQDKASLEKLFAAIGEVDAIVSAAGGGAFKPITELSDEDYAFSLGYKLMGQINVIRTGMKYIRPGGSITVTSGTLARVGTPAAAAIGMINAGLEGFVRSAALDLKGKVRLNVVSPPWVAETLSGMGQDPAGGQKAADVAKAYVKVITGTATGQIIDTLTGKAV